MQIITNADDLGINGEVNNAIFDLMSEGLVTSATLLANGPAMAEACSLIHRFPRCSFGVHLNLTKFKPLSRGRGLSPLLNEQGTFNGRIREIGGWGRIRQAVFDEWCAQIDTLAGRGVAISHLDSHHHVHTILKLFTVLKAIQREYAIRKVRLSWNVYHPATKLPRLMLLKKGFFNELLRRWYGTRTTAAFTDLPSFCANRGDFPSRHDSVEIMLHPRGAASSGETALLRELAVSDLDFRNSLISYNEL